MEWSLELDQNCLWKPTYNHSLSCCWNQGFSLGTRICYVFTAKLSRIISSVVDWRYKYFYRNVFCLVHETLGSQSLTQRAENPSRGFYLGHKCKTGKPKHCLTPYSVIRPAYYYYWVPRKAPGRQWKKRGWSHSFSLIVLFPCVGPCDADESGCNFVFLHVWNVHVTVNKS